MTADTHSNQPEPTDKENGNEKPNEDTDASPPDIVQNLGNSFRAGQIFKAMISGATGAVVREGIDYIMKNHGG